MTGEHTCHGVEPEPVVVKFKAGNESEFERPDRDPHGEMQALTAHCSASCDNCGKTGLVLEHDLAYAAGEFHEDDPERDVICEHCGSLDHT